MHTDQTATETPVDAYHERQPERPTSPWFTPAEDRIIRLSREIDEQIERDRADLERWKAERGI